MKLSVEILDHIFSFLVSDRGTLIACSKDPVLSQIVERHLYYFITVYFGDLEHSDFDFRPDLLSKFISEKPRILYDVRILKIRVFLDYYERNNEDIKKNLDQFAQTLLMFPVLECIQLTTPEKSPWHWPDVFRAALEDRLGLPTLKEVHIVGRDLPCSLIDNRKNIENLLLSGSYLGAAERRFCVSTFPQLKSLTSLSSLRHSFLASVKPHIKELRSLKCASSAVSDLPELFEVCSQTLNKLDIDLLSTCYYSNYIFWTGEVINNFPMPELSPVPPNLQQLTIRARVAFQDDGDRRRNLCSSDLPAAAKIIKLFASSLQHLILEIDIFLCRMATNLAKIDFSPLAVLGAASLSIPRIDLYVHTGMVPSMVTLAQLLSSLADNDNIMRSIKEGKLVVHSEETAPEYIERPFYPLVRKPKYAL